VTVGVRRLALVLAVWPPDAMAAQSGGASVLALRPGSTRSAALAGAGAALVGEAGAIFANPAGIATIRHLGIEGSYEPYHGGVAVSSAALALRVGRLTWGFGAQALDSGAAFPPAEGLAIASLVFRRGLIAVGVAGKYDRQKTGTTVNDAWGGDAGIAIALFDLMAFGVSVQNLGGVRGPDPRLPRRTRAGFTLNYTDPQGTFRLLTTVEGQWVEDRSAQFIQGLEAGLVTSGVGLAARAGYASRPALPGGSRVSWGGGVVLGGGGGHLHFDYAFQGHPALGDTHRLGLRWAP
jgi:hypothetical protein